jgi:formate hydrogenlyase transcriptional activator
MDASVRYHWPGNIRKLQNVMERAVIKSKGPVLTVALEDFEAQTDPEISRPTHTSLDDTLHQIQRSQILRALEQANWITSGPNGAATRLRIKRSTLLSRMQRLGSPRARNCKLPESLIQSPSART